LLDGNIHMRDTIVARTAMSELDDPAAEWLLVGAPLGQYLLEFIDGCLVLWRISEGAPDDEALEPAAHWPWLAAEMAR
jgi:hypothetical protein